MPSAVRVSIASFAVDVDSKVVSGSYCTRLRSIIKMTSVITTAANELIEITRCLVVSFFQNSRSLAGNCLSLSSISFSIPCLGTCHLAAGKYRIIGHLAKQSSLGDR